MKNTGRRPALQVSTDGSGLAGQADRILLARTAVVTGLVQTLADVGRLHSGCRIRGWPRGARRLTCGPNWPDAHA